MTLYESPQVQQWRIEYAELREEFGTELSEFEFVAQKAKEPMPSFNERIFRQPTEAERLETVREFRRIVLGQCFVCGDANHNGLPCPLTKVTSL